MFGRIHLAYRVCQKTDVVTTQQRPRGLRDRNYRGKNNRSDNRPTGQLETNSQLYSSGLRDSEILHLQYLQTTEIHQLCHLCVDRLSGLWPVC